MAETFGYCWRTVRLYCPAAPTFLAREWVNAAWKQLAAARRWGFMRGELALTINASRAISACVVTRGSTQVTSAGLFLSADAGRQFQVSTFPTYTIQTFTDVNTIELDRAYGEDSDADAAATVLDAYATMPADFGSFRIIADPYNQRRLAFWITEDQINIMDPTRSAGDSGPRCLIARAPSTYTPTLGRVQYEYWPRPTAARSYPALYNKQADRLNDSDTFTGVLADGAEVIVAGALMQAAQWPGTGDKPNPYFNAGIARDKRGEFLDGIQKLSLRDDEQYPDDLATVNWSRWPLADLAYNDAALRATDATVGDLY
jgi:hypothetical protein